MNKLKKEPKPKPTEKEQELLKSLLDNMPSIAAIQSDTKAHTDRLVEAAKQFVSEKFTFRQGELVVWKKGLKHKQVPEYGIPAIVMEVLQNPILDEEAPLSSPYYREKLDIVLGIIDEEGDFLCFYYDSRRFEPYQM